MLEYVVFYQKDLLQLKANKQALFAGEKASSVLSFNCA